ncbi:site-specific integrase [Pontibacter sp. BT731]|uniref:site-specific integrase n=1 Tax=Pontibacter coccineus TaxID=3063328 RepID=UPI0026E4066D|nr:site-specific integrase [Pontibacter sp. BT731]MDO6392085.1 site-specific integrase [Pontibacter sp. BT731]
MNIRYYIDKPNATNETAIYLFVRNGKKKLKFNTGRKIHPKYWDISEQEPKKGYPSRTKLNVYLTNLKTDVINAIEDLVQKGITTLEEAKDKIATIVAGKDLQETKVDFLQAYDQFLDVYKATRSEATVKKYKTIKNHLESFAAHKRTKLSFETIDAAFQENFVAYLVHQAKLTNNTIARKLKFLKTFLHWATERGYNAKSDYRKFKQKEEKVDIVTLSYDELMSLYNLDLTEKPKLERVRDVFCFGCFTGQRFSDIAALQPEHIKGDKWHLHTQKTKDILSIPLNVFALEILEKYTSKGKKLPAVSNQKTNEYLKELGKLAGIKDLKTHVRYQGAKRIQKTRPKYKFLGTHTARRTFCTISLKKGMLPEIVMKISGHKDYRTFRRYIDLDNNVVDIAMNSAWSK